MQAHKIEGLFYGKVKRCDYIFRGLDELFIVLKGAEFHQINQLNHHSF